MSVLKNINRFGFMQITDDEVFFLNNETDERRLFSFFRNRYFQHIGLTYRNFSDLPRILDRIGDEKKKREYIDEVVSFASSMREFFDGTIERNCREKKDTLLSINFNVFNSIMEPLHQEKVFLETASSTPHGTVSQEKKDNFIDAFSNALGYIVPREKEQFWNTHVDKLKKEFPFNVNDGKINFIGQPQYFIVALHRVMWRRGKYTRKKFSEFSELFTADGKKSLRNKVSGPTKKAVERFDEKIKSIFGLS